MIINFAFRNFDKKVQFLELVIVVVVEGEGDGGGEGEGGAGGGHLTLLDLM